MAYSSWYSCTRLSACSFKQLDGQWMQNRVRLALLQNRLAGHMSWGPPLRERRRASGAQVDKVSTVDMWQLSPGPLFRAGADSGGGGGHGAGAGRCSNQFKRRADWDPRTNPALPGAHCVGFVPRSAQPLPTLSICCALLLSPHSPCFDRTS